MIVGTPHEAIEHAITAIIDSQSQVFAIPLTQAAQHLAQLLAAPMQVERTRLIRTEHIGLLDWENLTLSKDRVGQPQTERSEVGPRRHAAGQCRFQVGQTDDGTPGLTTGLAVLT